MNTPLDREIELTKILKRYCYTIRKSRDGAPLAGAAGEWEMRLDGIIEELEARREREVAPQLKLVGAGGAK